MAEYRTNGAYVNTKFAFIGVILGCVAEEIEKIDRYDEPERFNDLCEALNDVTYSLFTSLSLETSIPKIHDKLEAVENCKQALKVQAYTDKLMEILPENVRLVIDSTQEDKDEIMNYAKYLPDFKGKITVKFE